MQRHVVATMLFVLGVFDSIANDSKDDFENQLEFYIQYDIYCFLIFIIHLLLMCFLCRNSISSKDSLYNICQQIASAIANLTATLVMLINIEREWQVSQ